jgi:hypothetical protein
MSKVMERRAVAKAGIKGVRSQGTKSKRTTHLSASSTSKMSKQVNELNRKVLKFINN